MLLKTVHIHSFGTLRDRDFSFGPGLNVVEGDNESGKTALSMFLKFVFYGLSGRPAEGGLSERQRFVSWETGEASGYVLLEADGTEYRVERALQQSSRVGQDGDDRESYRESLRIVDTASGSPVLKNRIPGEVFFGLPEEVFVNTVFIRQLSGSAVNGQDISAAIENLLVSGDETMNTKKALGLLDDARRALLYKNGKGGLLYEKRQLKLQADAVLAAARQTATESLEEETLLLELQSRRQDWEKKLTSLKRQNDCLVVFGRARQLAALASETERVAQCRRERAAFDDSPATEGHLAALAETRSELLRLENQKETQEQALQALDKQLSRLAEGTDIPDADAAEAAFRSQQSRKRSLTAAGIVLFVLAAAALGGAALLGFFSKTAGSALTVLSAFLLAGGVLLLTARARAAGAQRALLAQYGVSGDGAELRPAVEERARTARERRRLEETRTAQSEDIRVTEAQLAAQESRAAALAGRVGVSEPEDLSLRLDAAENVTRAECARRSAAEAALAEVSARQAYLAQQLRDTDAAEVQRQAASAMETEDGRRAAALDAAGAADVQRQISFYSEKLRTQAVKERELEIRQAERKATAKSPAEAQEAADALGAEIAALTARYEAYVLAWQTLTDAAERIRRGVLPRIVREAGRILTRFSAGRYGTLGADGQFRLSYTDGGVTRPLEALSAGTRDIAYVSLRLALIAVLSGSGAVPAIFDESFARVDEGRLAEIVGFLDAPEAGQTVLLTCRRAEAEAAGNGFARVIRL